MSEKLKNIYTSFMNWFDSRFHKVKVVFDKILNFKDVRYILFLYLVVIIMFGYTLVTNYWTIPVSGDFYIQEIPFYYNGYDDWWSAFSTGEFPLWDESAFLGVNNIGANAFYYLLNIFFMPTLLFPRSIVPQVQATLIITKFVLAGLAMKKLISMFGCRDMTCKMVGVAYAFCGWNMFYLWFNHFLEVSVLLPLVLIGLEKCLRQQKPCLLCAMLFLSAVTNYFFFIAFCFTSVMYAVFRYFQLFRSYTKEEKIKTILYGFIAYVVALIMALFILVPAFSSVMSNSRVTSATYLADLKNALLAFLSSFKTFKIATVCKEFVKVFKVLFVWDKSDMEKNFFYPFITFFYPTISCFNNLLIQNSGYDNALSSLGIYAPLMLFLVPSIIVSFRKKKVSHFVAIIGLLILLVTPFAYYCFSGFTSVAYGRWQLFVVCALCIYIGINMDDTKDIPGWTLDVSLIVTLLAQLLLFKYAYSYQGKGGTYQIDSDSQTGIIAYIVYTVICYAVMRARMKKQGFQELMMYIISIEAVVCCSFLLQVQGTQVYADLYGGKDEVAEHTEIVSQLKKEDPTFYRIFDKNADRDATNQGMVEGYNGIGTFHSVYDYSLDEFLSWSHITYGNGGWSMGVHEKRLDLDTFLGIKYYLLPADDTNVPLGYTEIMSSDTTKVYRNDNHIELGYSFPLLISKSALSSSAYSGTTLKDEVLYLTGGILSEEDIEEINSSCSFPVYNDMTSALSYYSSPVYTPKIYTSNVEIHKAVWDTNVQGQFDGYVYEDEDGNSMIDSGFNINGWQYGGKGYSYSYTDASGLLWNSYMIVTPNAANPIAPDAASRGGAFVSVKQRMGENLIITLYGEGDKILTSDGHMVHWYNKTGDYKYERGFYVNEEVKKIEIRVQDTLSSSQYLVQPEVTYEYYDSYKQRMDYLKNYQFDNIKKTSNNMSFDTSYEDTRFIVLQVPYDKGWSLKITDENGKKVDSKIYVSTGGFISFVAPEGNMHYELKYVTPGLRTGAVGLLIGIYLFTCMYYVIEIKEAEKKFINKSLDLSL